MRNPAGSGIKVNFLNGLGDFAKFSSNSALTNNAGQAIVKFSGTVGADVPITAIIEKNNSYQQTNVTLTPVNDYNITVTASPDRIKNNGIDKSIITAHLENQDGTPAKNIKVNFNNSSGNISAKTATTDNDGNVVTTFTSLTEGFAFLVALPVGGDVYKAANIGVEVYDGNGSNELYTLSFTGSKNTYTNEAASGENNSIFGTLTAILRDNNNNAVLGKEIRIQCVSGAACLSYDGSLAFETFTGTTNSRGQVKANYDRVGSESAGEMIFKASLVEDESVYKLFNVSQNGSPDGVN